MSGSSEHRTNARHHVAAIAALGRLGRQGGWDRLRAGERLRDLDRVDAELLAAAGVVGRVTGDRYSVSVPEIASMDGTTVGHGVTARLQRALQHLDRSSTGWSGADPELLLNQGRSSAVIADVIASEMLPRMPGSRSALESGQARFLDVGVGVAAICVRLCQHYDGLTCVGVDVLDISLELAADELARHGLVDRVELRHQSVVDLADEDAFDLAWLPQPFIARADLVKAIAAVARALRPDRWVVIPLADTTEADPFDIAVAAHEAEMLGGGPLPAGEAEALLAEAGLVDVLETSWLGQTFLLARQP